MIAAWRCRYRGLPVISAMYEAPVPMIGGGSGRPTRPQPRRRSRLGLVADLSSSMGSWRTGGGPIAGGGAA